MGGWLGTIRGEHWIRSIAILLAGALAPVSAADAINAHGGLYEIHPVVIGGLVALVVVLGMSVLALALSFARRRRAERALRRSEERFRALIETTSDWIWEVDDLARFTYASPRVHDVLGYQPEELIGQSVYAFLSPGQADTLRAALQPFVDNARPFSQLTHAVRRKDGSVAVVESSGVPFCDADGQFIGYRGIDRDVTERKRAESALRLTQFAIDHASAAAFWMNADGQFIYVNEAACRALDYSAEELLRLYLFDIDPNVKQEQWALLRERARKGGVREESCHQRKDGTLIPVEVVSNYLDFEGDAYICAFARDISARKQVEGQLRQAQKMEAVGQLAGGVAHDFNNMLGGIMGAAELVRMDACGNEAIESNIDLILRSASRAAGLTNKLLAFSRKGQVTREPVDIHAVVHAATDLLRHSIDRRIEIAVELNAKSFLVVGDAALLQSALLNMCINGRDAMPDGGQLTLTTRNVVLGDEICTAEQFDIKPGLYVQLRIADTGNGMEQEVVSHIFEPFFTTKAVGHGTGLGLSAVYGTVVEHGGMIQVRTAPGEGATFTVSLPVWREPLMSGGEGPVAATPGAARGVLLVDDDDEIRRVVGLMLERNGYRVFSARDGGEGVERFRTDHEHIDVVLLDMRMPRMQGSECFGELLKIDPSARVIMASGFSDREEVDALLLAGLKGFVHKPYRREELEDAIARAME